MNYFYLLCFVVIVFFDSLKPGLVFFLYMGTNQDIMIYLKTVETRLNSA